MTEYEFTVVIERDEDGRYFTICPALQGCYTEGGTEDEARSLIADAIHLHVQDRLAVEILAKTRRKHRIPREA